MSKTCLCSFSKSHFEKQVTIPPTSASTAPAPAGENALALSSIRPRNYSSQGKQWKPTDSSLSKLDWTEYFQIFSRRQSCSSQALMSVISIICFSIQLQLKTAKFFSTHYGTKWLLNYVMGFFSFFKKKKEKKRNQHLLAVSSCSLTATLIITATAQWGPSLTTSNLITLINSNRARHAEPSSDKSITSHLAKQEIMHH